MTTTSGSRAGDEIARTAREQLADRFPIDRLLGGSPEPTVDEWRNLADLGWLGLGVETSLGGVGCSLVEEVALFEEIGRAVAPGPFLGTVIAAHLAANSGCRDVARDLIAGTSTAAIVVGSTDQRTRLLDHRPGALLLSLGPASVLMDNQDAQPIRRADCVDPTATISDVRLEPAHTSVVARAEGAAGESLLARAVVLVAAMQAGIARAALDRSVGYVSERRQFGRAIGSFQAVKHRCADMAVRARAATTLTRRVAAGLTESGTADLAASAAAKWIADDAARDNAADAIQNFGGIGYTWDQGVHLLVTRQLINRRLALTTDEAQTLVAAASTSVALWS